MNNNNNQQYKNIIEFSQHQILIIKEYITEGNNY